MGTERKALGEKAQHLGWGILMACDAVETEGLSQVGREGEGRIVQAMFVLFPGGWVLGTQAGFHSGVTVSGLCASGM